MTSVLTYVHLYLLLGPNWNAMHATSTEFLNQFVWPTPNIQESGLDCKLCKNIFSSAAHLSKHSMVCIKKLNENKLTENQAQDAKAWLSRRDGKYNLVTNVLSMGFTWRAKKYATNIGHGDANFALNKLELIPFRVDGRTKYAYATLQFLIDIQVLFSDRVAFDALYNRFINGTGMSLITLSVKCFNYIDL